MIGAIGPAAVLLVFGAIICIVDGGRFLAERFARWSQRRAERRRWERCALTIQAELEGRPPQELINEFTREHYGVCGVIDEIKRQEPQSQPMPSGQSNEKFLALAARISAMHTNARVNLIDGSKVKLTINEDPPRRRFRAGQPIRLTCPVTVREDILSEHAYTYNSIALGGGTPGTVFSVVTTKPDAYMVKFDDVATLNELPGEVLEPRHVCGDDCGQRD